MSAARGLRIAYAFSIAILLLIGIYFYWPLEITGNVVYDETLTHTNFSKSAGLINPTFFGVNTHGLWGSEPTPIDPQGDGTFETYSDPEWHRTKLQDARIMYLRADMSLETAIYSGNNDAEIWNQTTASFSGSATIDSVPVGWRSESVLGIGSIAQAANSHSGNYGVSINNTGSAGTVFSKKDLGTLAPGHDYNFSVWVNSQAQIQIHIQRTDNWSSLCVASSSGSGQWEQVSCTMNPVEEAPWRLVIEAPPRQHLIWDDASLTRDGTEIGSRPIIGNLEGARDLVKWAHENDITIQYIASYMPPHMANVSVSCAAAPSRCPPKNYSQWADLVVQFIDEATNDGQYSDVVEIEVWNEPDLPQFWLPGLQSSDTNRFEQYNLLYNATYSAVKAKYPAMAVGGPALADIANPNGGKLFLHSFLSRFPHQTDFISFHQYTHTTDYDMTIAQYITQLQTDCQTYDADCGRIAFNEFNVWDSTTKLNDPGEHAKQLAIAYAYLLNTMPENITTAQYQWSESRPFRDGIGYPEYPQRWSMVSEPALDNALYASYNVTKDFATYHSAGSTVVESTSADPQVRIVASYKGDDRYVTIINGKNVATPVTLGLAGVNASAVIDLKTNLSYPVVDSVVDLGAFAPAQIRHFRVLDADVPISETGLNETPLNNSVNETNLTNETGLNESLNLTIDGQANGTGANESINESEGSLNESPQEPLAPAQIDIPIRISRGGGGGGAPRKALNATLNVSANSTAADLTQAGDRSETGAQRKSPPSQERKTAVVTEEYERAVLYESELTPQESTVERPAAIEDDKAYWALVAGCASLIGYLAYHRAKRPRHL